MPTYRRRPRAPLNVLLNKVVGESMFMCHASDISEDGIFLSRLLEPSFSGSEVALELALPGDEEILWARGEIVRQGHRRRCEGSAIRFTILPEAYRRKIQRYVERNDLAA
ncbi:MAG: PilZ domain-containing protein [Myxococcales bacterium]